MLDYRAFGDPMNTAAHLESANKQTGTRVCISADTAAGCAGFEWRPTGELLLKGKREVLLAYEPVTSAGVGAAQLAGYRRAYTLLADHDPNARAAFADLVRRDRSDGLARFHLARLEPGEFGTPIVLAQNRPRYGHSESHTRATSRESHRHREPTRKTLARITRLARQRHLDQDRSMAISILSLCRDVA
jgi:hypothetical protein